MRQIYDKEALISVLDCLKKFSINLSDALSRGQNVYNSALSPINYEKELQIIKHTLDDLLDKWNKR
jgi:hypothetical protein